MEQDVRFISAPDGVKLAVATAGSGAPLVVVSHWITHVEIDWNWGRQFFEPLASRSLLVRYDKRGTGMSDRDVRDYSPEAYARDLEAVIDTLDLHNVTLLGASQGAPMCINYAVQHPENVSNLIVYGGFHNGRTAFFRELVEAFIGLIRADWGGYGTATMLDVFAPSAPSEARDFFIEYQRQSATAENAAATWLACFDFDVTALLPQVRAPTLVLHRRGDRAVPFEQGREIAAAIPGAHFVALEDDNHHLLSDPQPVVEAIERFLYGAEPRPARKSPESMTAILFADIVDSTALTERLGDAAFRAKARELDGSLRAVIREHAGTAIEGKLLGDGVLAVFTSARQAIEAALACAKAGAEAALPIHLGLHAGDVIHEDNNVYGGAVNVASRISALSAPGEVLVSDIVRGLARTSAGVRFEDRGEQALRGIAEPLRVFAVREDASSGSRYSSNNQMA